jgi:hypothetical protein
MSTSIDIDELLWNLESAKDRGIRSVVVYDDHGGPQQIKGTQVWGTDDGDVFMIWIAKVVE